MEAMEYYVMLFLHLHQGNAWKLWNTMSCCFYTCIKEMHGSYGILCHAVSILASRKCMEAMEYYVMLFLHLHQGNAWKLWNTMSCCFYTCIKEMHGSYGILCHAVSTLASRKCMEAMEYYVMLFLYLHQGNAWKLWNTMSCCFYTCIKEMHGSYGILCHAVSTLASRKCMEAMEYYVMLFLHLHQGNAWKLWNTMSCCFYTCIKEMHGSYGILCHAVSTLASRKCMEAMEYYVMLFLHLHQGNAWKLWNTMSCCFYTCIKEMHGSYGILCHAVSTLASRKCMEAMEYYVMLFLHLHQGNAWKLWNTMSCCFYTCIKEMHGSYGILCHAVSILASRKCMEAMEYYVMLFLYLHQGNAWKLWNTMSCCFYTCIKEMHGSYGILCHAVSTLASRKCMEAMEYYVMLFLHLHQGNAWKLWNTMSCCFYTCIKEMHGSYGILCHAVSTLASRKCMEAMEYYVMLFLHLHQGNAWKLWNTMSCCFYTCIKEMHGSYGILCHAVSTLASRKCMEAMEYYVMLFLHLHQGNAWKLWNTMSCCFYTCIKEMHGSYGILCHAVSTLASRKCMEAMEYYVMLFLHLHQGNAWKLWNTMSCCFYTCIKEMHGSYGILCHAVSTLASRKCMEAMEYYVMLFLHLHQGNAWKLWNTMSCCFYTCIKEMHGKAPGFLKGKYSEWKQSL